MKGEIYMHYSSYLRGIPKPQTTTQPVVNTPPVSSPEPVKVEPVPAQEFKEVNPDDVQLNFTALVQSQEGTSAPKPKLGEPTSMIQGNDPIVGKLVDLLSKTQDIVTKAKMNKLLDVMFEGLEEQIHEPETILDEEEAGRIAEYFISLVDKYFSDIAISQYMPRYFIWNIPRAMYEDMCEAQDNGVIDILNPMVYLYIALCGYPGKAAARFFKILENIKYENVNQFNQYDAEYQQELDEESSDEEDNESIAENFARNGYAEEDDS
jgi:hypothetical protein